MRLRRHTAGFTLLELMVVLVLMGIILTFVVRAVGDGGRSELLEREARRIQALVELVGEEAVLRSAVFGLRLEEHGYSFLRYDGELWSPVMDDSLLKPRELGEEMGLELFLDGLAVSLVAEASGKGGLTAEAGAFSAEGEDTTEEPPPQVVFLPSGERTPFELSLFYRDDEWGYRLTALPLGPLQRSRFGAEG